MPRSSESCVRILLGPIPDVGENNCKLFYKTEIDVNFLCTLHTVLYMENEYSYNNNFFWTLDHIKHIFYGSKTECWLWYSNTFSSNNTSSDQHFSYRLSSHNPPITFSNVTLTVSHLSFSLGTCWLIDVWQQIKG